MLREVEVVFAVLSSPLSPAGPPRQQASHLRLTPPRRPKPLVTLNEPSCQEPRFVTYQLLQQQCILRQQRSRSARVLVTIKIKHEGCHLRFATFVRMIRGPQVLLLYNLQQQQQCGPDTATRVGWGTCSYHHPEHHQTAAERNSL